MLYVLINLGVNSGVMLMHLSRMRQFGWVKYLAPIYKEFRLKLTWGDQDIINIFFHFHPGKFMLLVFNLKNKNCACITFNGPHISRKVSYIYCVCICMFIVLALWSLRIICLLWDFFVIQYIYRISRAEDDFLFLL